MGTWFGADVNGRLSEKRRLTKKSCDAKCKEDEKSKRQAGHMKFMQRNVKPERKSLTPEQSASV
jgi:hypothetical protein